MACGTYAVIPVKPFSSAKSRLAPILSSFERASLARLMFEDVLDAVSAARSLAGFAVVTCDGEAAAMASARAGRVVRESGELGLTHAVGTAFLALSGIAAGVVVVPADIPHLPSATIDAVVDRTAQRSVTMVPAICDGGTNLLSVRPWHLLLPQFGPGSFDRHSRAALRMGARTAIHICPMASWDLDRPRDLLTFLAFNTKTRTHGYLASLEIAARIAEADDFADLSDTLRASA
jgi:2-phospho-L-lactate/phosphoenolpyruvate guanylyltransferase